MGQLIRIFVISIQKPFFLTDLDVDITNINNHALNMTDKYFGQILPIFDSFCCKIIVVPEIWLSINAIKDIINIGCKLIYGYEVSDHQR